MACEYQACWTAILGDMLPYLLTNALLVLLVVSLLTCIVVTPYSALLAIFRLLKVFGAGDNERWAAVANRAVRATIGTWEGVSMLALIGCGGSQIMMIWTFASSPQAIFAFTDPLIQSVYISIAAAFITEILLTLLLFGLNVLRLRLQKVQRPRDLMLISISSAVLLAAFLWLPVCAFDLILEARYCGERERYGF